MILADKIIENRKKNGWSQEELAEKLGVSRQSVSKWEGAQSMPDMKKILQLAEVFDVSTDYLLKDEIEEKEPSDIIPVETGLDEPARSVSMEEANTFLTFNESAAKTISTGFVPKAQAWSRRPHLEGVRCSPQKAMFMTPSVFRCRPYSSLKALVTRTQIAAEEDRPLFMGRSIFVISIFTPPTRYHDEPVPVNRRRAGLPSPFCRKKRLPDIPAGCWSRRIHPLWKRSRRCPAQSPLRSPVPVQSSHYIPYSVPPSHCVRRRDRACPVQKDLWMDFFRCSHYFLIFSRCRALIRRMNGSFRLSLSEWLSSAIFLPLPAVSRSGISRYNRLP